MKSRVLHPLGALIVQERKRLGMSQYALAKRLRKNTRELAVLEKGLREPRFGTLLMLADALEISVGEFAEKLAAMVRKQRIENAAPDGEPNDGNGR
jgi:transcriptional regulator with XRE-family HTH domain